MFVVYFQVTVDHPQAAFVDASTSTLAAASTAGHSTAAAKSTEPSTSAPQPQQVLIHQSKTAAPAHSKVDRHHVDVRPITAISDVYMGTGMGGTVQGHLSSGASKCPHSLQIGFFVFLEKESWWMEWFIGHTVTIIVMVCAGFLLLMISLGVVRVRAARRRAQQDETTADTEMAWDDSALTITVNPMEVSLNIFIN